MEVIQENDLLLLKKHFKQRSRFPLHKFIGRHYNKTTPELLAVKDELTKLLILVSFILVPSIVVNLYLYITNNTLGNLAPFEIPLISELVKLFWFTGLTAIVGVFAYILIIDYVRKRLKVLNFIIILANDDEHSENLRANLKRTGFR